MLGSLANAWKIPELRTRLLFTFAMLAAYRLGAYIPLPGVDPSVLGGGLQSSNPITGLFGTFTGGAFNNFSVFSLGIMPYITAAIVMQLMTVAIPRLQELAKEGETGQQKITQYTRYFTLALALIQSVAMVLFFRSAQGGGALAGTSPIEILVAIVTLTAGVMLTMWLGELISQRGLGNGISLIITASILSQAPLAITALRENGDVLTVVILGLLAVMIVAAIVFVNEGQRRIPITYAKRQVGRRMSQGGTTYLPLKVNMAGVIPIIFASSLLLFPVVLAQLAAGGDPDSILARLSAFFDPGNAPYLILYALLIIMFTYFYTAVQFNPVEHADNLKKSGGYVPGYRPGQPTAIYLNNVLTRITLFGALFLAVVAVLPYFISSGLGLGNQHLPRRHLDADRGRRLTGHGAPAGEPADDAQLRRVPEEAMKVILLGPQGAGKGTQAQRLADEVGATHISTGDIVRAEIKSGSELGKKVQDYNDRGELVPDEIIVEMAKPYLDDADSWLLDGFPRNEAQAKALDQALEDIGEDLDAVVALEAPDDALVERLSGRRQSQATGKIYHVEYDPPPERMTRARSSSAMTTPRKPSGAGWRSTTTRPSL